jgi:hypothetical protein
MRAVRLGAIVFGFLTLVSGYAVHQYLLFTSSTAFDDWLPKATTYSVYLGWILLLAGVALSVTSPEKTQ